MSGELVKVLDGNTFVVSDDCGDIEASLTDPTGLFAFDTRFLSKWVLTIDGQRLNALSVDDLQYFETRFFLVPGTGTGGFDGWAGPARIVHDEQGAYFELKLSRPPAARRLGCCPAAEIGPGLVSPPGPT